MAVFEERRQGKGGSSLNANEEAVPNVFKSDGLAVKNGPLVGN